MTNTLNKKDLLDKNVNFLFGSGASAPYIPTFMTSLTDAATGKQLSFEDLLSGYTYFSTAHSHLIYYWYYIKIITKTYVLSDVAPPPPAASNDFSTVNSSYDTFAHKLNDLLKRKNNHIPRRANIFTTNYDLFFEKSINDFQQQHQLILNDGGSGIINRTLNISNFHRATMHQGTDDRYSYEIPTVNLIKMHGSVSWKKQNDLISIDYSLSPDFSQFSSLYQYAFPDPNTDNLLSLSTVQELQSLIIPPDHEATLHEFDAFYQTLSIVNPTKEKFSETVFQQHYYQSLRLLSQELERPQTALICFGFSFADEHIREIIQRSLSNPELHIYIYAYSHDTQFTSFLEIAHNVTIIRPDKHSNIPFDEFNKRVL